MSELEKYRMLSAGKAFGDRAKIAMALLDSKTAYEELKEEAAQSMVAGSYSCAGGDPSVILEQITIEMICRDTRNTWYLPDTVKFWDRRFGSLLEAKFFCYDDDAEILAVVKQNHHPEFDKYYEIAVQNGMDPSVLEKKLKELTEVKQSFIEIETN